MMKKKDQLLDVVKKNGQAFIYPFLDPKSILSLALLSQKYYLAVNPFLTALILDNTYTKGSVNKKEPKANKKNKNKAKNEEKTIQNNKEIEVDLNRLPINKIK